MGATLDYFNTRIKLGNTNFSNFDFNNLQEINLNEYLINNCQVDLLNNHYKIYDNNFTLIGEICYNENIDFNYFTSSYSYNDGTLALEINEIENTINRIFNCETYNKSIVDEEINIEFFNKKYFKYTVGNILLNNEYNDNFATKEKPWLRQRTAVIIPIKFEVCTKGEDDCE